jgi:hypothetical protein
MPLIQGLDPLSVLSTWIPLKLQAWVILLGATAFGTVVGRMVRQVLVTTPSRFDTTALTAIVGVIGGGAVTALISNNPLLFGAYSLGLAAAFFVGPIRQRGPLPPG